MRGGIARAVGVESVTEGLQEGVVIASGEIAKTTGHLDIEAITGGEAVSRMIDAGRQALTAVLPYAAVGGGARTYANRRIRQARQSAAALDQLHKLASESETIQQAPDLAGEFIQRLGEDGGASEVYIRPEAVRRVFFQTEEGMVAAAEMGITPESLAESLALDADIAIPIDKATLHILNNEQAYNELSQDMRAASDVMTPRESESFTASKEGAPSQMDQEGFDFLDTVFAGLDEEIAANQHREAMAAPYVEQLTAAGYSEQQARHLMTPYVAHAEVMASMFGQTPDEYLGQRLAGFQSATPLSFAAADAHGRKALFQPLNQGVDLDAPVRIVSVTPLFAGQNPKILRKRFPAAIREKVLSSFNSPQGIVNEDTEKKVGMSARDFNEHLKFDDTDTIDGVSQLEAIAALPELMQTAKLVETFGDTKANMSIKAMHRFQGALRIGVKEYSVKLTVKEFKDGFLAIDANSPLKLYHHRLEKEMPAGNSASLSHGDPSPQPSAGITEYTLRQLLEDVNDSAGNVFFHNGRENAASPSGVNRTTSVIEPE